MTDLLTAGDQPLVWLDMETTGLFVDRVCPQPLEVAVIVTDSDLNEVDAYESLVDVPGGMPAVYAAIDANAPEDAEYVRNMHTESGLFAAMQEVWDAGNLCTGLAIDEIDRNLENFLNRHKVTRAPLAGSSCGFDREVALIHLPVFSSLLHYRTVDVSTLKELSRRWWPEVAATIPSQVAGEKHRALSDLRTSIAELRHYGHCLGVVNVPVAA